MRGGMTKVQTEECNPAPNPARFSSATQQRSSASLSNDANEKEG